MVGSLVDRAVDLSSEQISHQPPTPQPNPLPLTTPSPAPPQSRPADALHTSHCTLERLLAVLLKNDFPASTGLRFPPVRSQFYASISHLCIPGFSRSPLFTIHYNVTSQNIWYALSFASSLMAMYKKTKEDAAVCTVQG